MNGIFESKGKLIAIFSVIIVIITALAVFWAYKTIDTNIDMDELENSQIVIEEVAEEPEIIEPEFRRAGEMRGIVLNPGLDFLKSPQDDAQTIEEQVSEALEKAKKYEFNSIIINTTYKVDEENKVIYTAPDANTFKPEADDQVDIYNIVSQKVESEGIYVYALVDINDYKDATDNLFTVDNYEDRMKSSKIYTNINGFTERYQPDGILITGYQNNLDAAQKEEYASAGGELSLEEYLLVAAELNLKAVSEAIKDISIDIQFGILANPVWENIEENPEGSQTQAEETALSHYLTDTNSMISSDMFDFVLVETDTKIGDEKSDFEDIIDWWDSLARKTKAPIYIMSAASKVGDAYDNKELAKQAEAVDKISEIKGIVFDGLSYLDGKEESSNNLQKYYSGDTEAESALEGSETVQTPKEPTTPPPVVTTPPKTPTAPVAPAAAADAITLNAAALSLRIGESKQLITTITPKTVNQEANWSSENRAIAKVDGNGNVTAVAKGVVKISATSAGGRVAVCTVTVTEDKVSTPTVATGDTIAVTEISISVGSISVAAGKTQLLSVELRPDNATNKNVTWGSKDANIATVDTAGKVTGVAKGETVVTVTSVDGKKTAECKITVLSSDEVGPSGSTDSSVLKDVSTITVSGNSSNMYIKSSQTLVVKDQNGKVLSNSLFEWETSNRDVARVDAGGVVSSKSVAGSSTISAYNDEYFLYGTFKVAVSAEKVRVTAIEISPSTVLVAVGKTNTVKTILTPSNATVSDITWRVTNPNIATVDSSGVVTGKATGSTTLIAKAGSVQTDCKIEVTSKVEVDDIYIQDDSFELRVGDSDKLTVIIEPSGMDAKLLWQSSSPTVLEVDGSGNLKAKSAGKATITVKIEGNERYYDSLQITVVE